MLSLTTEYLQAFGTGLVKNIIDAYFPDHPALLCPAPVGQLHRYLTFSRALHPGSVTFHLSPFKLFRDQNMPFFSTLLKVVLCSQWPERWEISQSLCRQRAPVPLCIFYRRSSIVRNPSKRRAAILECSPLIVKCLLIILWFRAQRTHLLERLPHFPGGIEKEISHIKTLTWRVY